MSTFWSTWVIVLAVITFSISFLLLCWAPWVRIPTQADGTTTHVWAHGVLREGVKRLPRWWLVLSFASFFAAAAYVALFPGLGNYRGILGWTSEQALQEDLAAHQTKIAALSDRIGQAPVTALASDADVVRIGSRLFLDNCSACHGRDARGVGSMGAPDLLDADWLHGGTPAAIAASILDGREGVMPPFGSTLGSADITNVAHYVASLSGTARDPVKAALGKPVFQNCAACHGADGKGNPALGAPNLTDSVWLYGGSIPAIERTVRSGRHGSMPAWRDRLGEDGVKAIAAWIARKGGIDGSGK
jgi:cytochrome c oxidase cbb3-type subunit 3